ncbi:MAG: hypothetical protein A2506_08930 [Elusimicrobia bacterium RIFOXYD12_FULL_66_9]|nr:MAG: hypothetical protein A2506_08930 [Elusimicrobia bacterium RIFOXYD12_FULL_66_9]
MSLVALLLALSASAQSPMPFRGDEPAKEQPAAEAAAAPAEAVAASTSTAEAAPSQGVKVAGDEKPRLKSALHLVIHPDAKDWEPLSLRAGGDPGQARNAAVLRQVRSKGKVRGVASQAKASARVIVSKNDLWLVVSVFPKSLEKKRCHFEIRFRVVERFVENVQVQAVSVVARDPAAGAGLDSFALRAAGIAFQEESPGSGQLTVSALDARPAKRTFNAGRLKLAAFADKALGFSDVSWSVRGLSAPR